ncbi:MAG: endopeptidase La [Candidatus Desulfofervidaceae bacterium]|nr:endopeptidase La [Candidatus Desulfofervidaceae bacterium]
MFPFNRGKEKEENSSPKEMITLPLLPLRDVVIFPHMVIPLFVGRKKSIAALEHAMTLGRKLFLAAQKSAQIDDPQEKDIYTVGTIGHILQLLKLPDGTVKVLIEGEKRAKIAKYLHNPNFFLVEVEEVEEVFTPNVETEALKRSLISAFEEYAKLNPKVTQETLNTVSTIEEIPRLADIVAAHLAIKIDQKQKVLGTYNVNKRLELVFGLTRGEIEIIRTEQRIKARVKKQMEKTQREYYLTEQMKAIQKEMGTEGDFKDEIKELQRKIKNTPMSKEAKQKALHELNKLKMMAPMSAEATVVRNYIDWLIALPWKRKAKVRLDIDKAKHILDEDHYGLEEPKERILEYLAVQHLAQKVKGPILCLVGPPGVGKTSLAKSVARATGREFVRLSLGGVRDEAEIRGHRRTYIGAMPGKIIQSLRKVKTNNPVFCLDEIDKLGVDFRGDPAAALLEVLDPEQNYAFNDHYLDVDYDLSEILFITTANTLHTIPWPLQDRMEIIRIPGYTEIEKYHIATRFLIPKQIKAAGLKPTQITFSEQAIYEIIRSYTKEAGVRNLERSIASICRKVAKEIVKKGMDTKIRITRKSLTKYLGVPKYRFAQTEERDEIGVSTGLAWTEFGGELLQTEVAIMPGEGKLTITGKLGEVMQESARAALSYVRTRAEQLGLETDFYKKYDIHIHVPEGAVPKDGPSAGITMATALVSALAKIPVRKDVAMTGEITLRGRVLPIGGLKEKLLAAHRGRVKKVIIPKDNEKDLKEIPTKILKSLQIVSVTHMDEVLREALTAPINVKETPPATPKGVSKDYPTERPPAVMM